MAVLNYVTRCGTQSQRILFRSPFLTRRSLSSAASTNKSNIISRRFYRLLNKELKSIDSVAITPFLLQRPLRPQSEYGNARTFQIDPNHNLSSWWTSTIDEEKQGILDSVWTSPDDLKRFVQLCFRTDLEGSVTERQGEVIRAIQLLQEQSSLFECTSVAEHEGVRITATSSYIGKSFPTSRTDESGINFNFAYRVRMENLSPKNIQLLGRTWHLREGPQDEHVMVQAPRNGAVGHFPVLRENTAFEYMSGCSVLDPAEAYMRGTMHFRYVDDDVMSAKLGDPLGEVDESQLLDVPVHPFRLKLESDDAGVLVKQ